MTFDSQFWVGLTQIIWIDLLLSGDNAVVIALACRRLPERQRRLGILFGSAAAIVLRVIFAAFILYLLEVSFLKLVGAVLLIWIAVKLVLPEEPADEDDVNGASTLFDAVRTIVIADAVMSLDNVIGIAAAAKGDVVLIVLGLLISIPLIVFGSTLILYVLDRFPQIAFIGGALLGFIAGDIVITDPALAGYLEPYMGWLPWVAPAAGVVLVLTLGLFFKRRAERRQQVKT